MKLTKNFTLEELCATNHKVENTPSREVENNLILLCENVLQPIRDKFGIVKINSGFRSSQLNKLVGGSATSEHVKGMAADIKVADMEECFDWIKENLEFTQLINEFNYSWIHVSFNENNLKKQVLKAVKIKGRTVYL